MAVSQAQPRSLAETPEGAALGFGDAAAACSSSSEDGEEADAASSEEADSDRDAAVAARARQVHTHTEAQQTDVHHGASEGLRLALPVQQLRKALHILFPMKPPKRQLCGLEEHQVGLSDACGALWSLVSVPACGPAAAGGGPGRGAGDGGGCQQACTTARRRRGPAQRPPPPPGAAAGPARQAPGGRWMAWAERSGSLTMHTSASQAMACPIWISGSS